MTEAPQELRTLVRRDVAVFAAGSVLAVWVAGILVAGHLGLVATRTAATVVVAVGGPLCVGCLWWWASGPRRWLRDRYLVLVPALLAGPSTALALYDLGASVVAVMISSALGFAAAVVLGLAWASRRG
jgi:hypothetical protein